MEQLIIPLITRLGIPLALVVLKGIQGTNTLEQAITALERIKTAQEYIDEDAKQRGVVAVPLPK